MKDKLFTILKKYILFPCNCKCLFTKRIRRNPHKKEFCPPCMRVIQTNKKETVPVLIDWEWYPNLPRTICAPGAVLLFPERLRERLPLASRWRSLPRPRHKPMWRFDTDPYPTFILMRSTERARKVVRV